MWKWNKKITTVVIVIFLVVQFRVLSWAISVQNNNESSISKTKLPSAIIKADDIIHQTSLNEELPTQFDYYTSGGVNSGLIPSSSDQFLLNGKPYKLIAGAIHYFRVHPKYWRDRLRKLRAAGVTAVETYVAWNLHEPERDSFDFGQGKNDMSLFLDLVSYLKIAQEEDLFVIFRPGPYICSEWDFGGLPSWLLKDETMQVRTSYGPYIQRADRFFEKLIPLVTELQFSTNSGPIIAVQVENEYGAFGYDDHPRDKAYLQHLANKLNALGIKEMLFTSDSPKRTLDWGAIPGVLQTANLQTGAAGEFLALRELQPNKPLMVTEFWSGWFDHWTQDYHSISTVIDFETNLKEILNFGASVSFYMFHGGTNFGFMNGANVMDSDSAVPNYLPDVTSYDYDSPLSEAGDYTAKYEVIRRLIPPALAVQTRLPERPTESPKKAYPPIKLESYITFNDLIDQVPENMIVSSNITLSMEQLPVGQSYGFIVYRKTLPLKSPSFLKVRGHIRDLAQVLVNGKLHTPPIESLNALHEFGSWIPRDAGFKLGSWKSLVSDPRAVLDIVVENLGRVNYGKPHDFKQKKGLWEGPIMMNGEELLDWKIISLEFKSNWVRDLTKWKPVPTAMNLTGPVLVRGTLKIADAPADTFLDMSNWGKGVVFVNGFNLGRYWSTVGPQKTLYLPAPLLKIGSNTIVIYEQYFCATKIKFSGIPKLGGKRQSVF